MKEFIEGFYKKPRIVKRFVICLIAVCIMGICVSWLNLIDWGMDPCSALNMSVADKIGISFGNYQALLNSVLFIVVFLIDKKQIGFGTFLNMFLVGYACDFMDWLRNMIWPQLLIESTVLKLGIMVIALSIFVVVASIYMTVDLGSSPYDAIIFILAGAQKKFSFRTVRVVFELIVITGAFIISGKFGIVTLAMALTLGPVVQWMGKNIEKLI